MYNKRLEFFLKKNITKHRINSHVIKNIRVSFIALSILTFVLTISYWNNQNYGLILSYNGKEIAKIENEEACEKINTIIKDQITNSDFEEISIIPEYKIVSVKNSDLTSPDEVKNIISKELKENMQPATGLYVDNKLVFATKNKDFLRNVLSELKQKYIKDKNLCSSFVEDIRMDRGLYSSKEIMPDDEAKDLILHGKKDIVSYEISESDNLDLICERFKTTAEKIKELNNLPDEFQIESLNTINVETFTKIIHVKYSQVEQKEVEIVFESIKTEDPSKFTNYKQITQEGINGLNLYIDEVTYIDDEEVTRINISHSTIKEKIDEQVIVGTKQIEEDSLLWPVPYTKSISSPFGYRDKEFHTGIDISSSGIAGQDILACSNGIVTYSNSDNSGYGKHIIISHQDGKISTLYAHCNKLLVKSGEKVIKGQKIAEVGSTGKSTGNHLHFEVRINGKPVNPKNYF